MQQKIGRYEVKSELGRGGMATVYDAYDPNFERDVAIKVLPPAFLHDPQFRVRFEREAKMIALLEHPAIVPVYDFGEQDGQPYIVMRYMSGGSLADRLKQGAIPLDETARIINRLAPALDVAHARGIIHRDLKPGNILFDQYGNAFLSDFGIARLVEAGSTTLTGESIVGTPAYMSPEQVKGDKAIDGHSDIYAMGILVYQMLTGSAPFRADTPAKIMMMHILEPVPDILRDRPDLPAPTARVLAKALAKEPEDRYGTTAAFAKALEESSEAASSEATRIAPVDDRTVFAAPTGSSSGAGNNATAVSTPRPGSIPRAGTGASAPPAQTPAVTPIPMGPPVKRRSPIMTIVLVLLFGGAIVVAGGLAYLGRQGTGPLAMLAAPNATATLPASPTAPLPSNTPESSPTTVPQVVNVQPTATPIPSATPTSAPTATPTLTATPEPARPVIGGADKVAFIHNGDIWSANLDGSELTQLTRDGTQKSSMQWEPGGEGVVYISGKCVERAPLDGSGAETVTCFNYIDSLKTFQISPDGSQAALTLDNQLYIIPYDIAALSQASNRNHIINMAQCADFAPYKRNFVTQVRWSRDGTILAAKLIANLGSGKQGDIIQLFHVDRCIPNPRAMDNFPPPRFDMRGYDKNPVIQNYSWDGTTLFALNSTVRNGGFGDLYIYNTDLKKVYASVNPVGNVCCYRDPQFSPDGTYLIFAFQDIGAGSSSTTQLYYIPYGSVGTGAKYEPLPLPEIEDPREKPLPVLRPAQ